MGRCLEQYKGMSTTDLIREWDTNGNGEIEKIELRMVVRNKMKIKADNKKIDALFDSLDQDGGGTLDAKEMGAALDKLKIACYAATEKREQARAQASELRVLADAFSAALAATDEVESLQAKVKGLSNGVCEGAVDVKMAAAIVSASKATSENDQRQKVLHAWDPNKEGSITKEVSRSPRSPTISHARSPTPISHDRQQPWRTPTLGPGSSASLGLQPASRRNAHTNSTLTCGRGRPSVLGRVAR